MTVFLCPQRGDEWHGLRAGHVTASVAHDMLAKPKRSGEDPVGKATLRLRLALELQRGVPLEEDDYESPWMRRGRERESDGIGAYEAESGEIVTPVGFCRHDTLPIGCSPDGLIGCDPDWAGGLELKCPKFTTHFAYLRQGTLPSEYVPQVTHSLFVTGLPWWDFVSFCPEFPGDARLFRARVPRTAVDLDAYALAFHLFWSEVEQITETVRGLRVAPELIHA